MAWEKIDRTSDTSFFVIDSRRDQQYLNLRRNIVRLIRDSQDCAGFQVSKHRSVIGNQSRRQVTPAQSQKRVLLIDRVVEHRNLLALNRVPPVPIDLGVSRVGTYIDKYGAEFALRCQRSAQPRGRAFHRLVVNGLEQPRLVAVTVCNLRDKRVPAL